VGISLRETALKLLLDNKVRQFNEILRHKDPDKPFDFSREDLSGKYLIGVDLSNTILVEAKLRAVDLSNADLSRANFSNADLSSSNFARAKTKPISSVSFTRAKLPFANFSNSELNLISLRPIFHMRSS
jgi:uncharacterized protein YjbI with pentapeptide repeats